MYENLKQKGKKIFFLIFVGMVVWFLIMIATTDWHAGILHYYQHLGM